MFFQNQIYFHEDLYNQLNIGNLRKQITCDKKHNDEILQLIDELYLRDPTRKFCIFYYDLKQKNFLLGKINKKYGNTNTVSTDDMSENFSAKQFVFTNNCLIFNSINYDFDTFINTYLYDINNVAKNIDTLSKSSTTKSKHYVQICDLGHYYLMTIFTQYIELIKIVGFENK